MKNEMSGRSSFTLAMMIAGLFFGLFLNVCFSKEMTSFLVLNFLGPLGDIFIRAIRMLVVPLVFFSLVAGTVSLRDIRKLGRIGGKIFGYYIITTVIAISLALFFTNLFRPGQGNRGGLIDTPAKKLLKMAAVFEERAGVFENASGGDSPAGSGAGSSDVLKKLAFMIEDAARRKVSTSTVKKLYEREIIPELEKLCLTVASENKYSINKTQKVQNIELIELEKIIDELKKFASELKEPPAFIELIVDIIPSNPVRAMVEEKMLQIIFFSIFLGLALVLLESDFTEKASVIFERCTSVVIKMIDTVMYFAPWCVFALVARVVALQGAGMLLNLISYVFTLLFVLLFHFIVVYCGALKFLGGVSPLKFLRKYWTVMVVGFSTSSSSATLPVNLEVCEKELGISNRVVSFSLPFGATVNMDGTAIMQGVAVLFIAQLYSIEPGITEQLQIILTCVLASIGTAGIPSAGLVMLTMVFQQAGLPLEAIGILWSVDRILDMTRTVVNVTGDAVASLVIAKSENEFDRTVFEA